MPHIRPVAIYLPQYHPIPENDQWWGAGFTEWTNVTKAKPLFRGHSQPRFPADLGYYDLRLSEVREKQAEIAFNHGIEGFCYYHYWFGHGRQILQRPFNEVLQHKKPDFPFMLCWANETWKGVWFGTAQNKTLIEQAYPGVEDYKQHFQYLLPAFRDSRYISVEGKPVFYVYMATSLPDTKIFTETFRACAHEAGFPGIYLIAGRCPIDWNPEHHGFDGVVGSEFSQMNFLEKATHSPKNKVGKLIQKLKSNIFSTYNKPSPLVIPYKDAIAYLVADKNFDFDYFPCAIPNWDNTPRAGENGMVLHQSTPELWAKHFNKAIEKTKNNPKDRQFIFIKSWNEWAESNYLEPDTEWGYAYLQVIKNLLTPK